MAVQRDTTINWAANVTPPAANDLCIDTDLLIHKIGDGVTIFAHLPIDYVGPDLGTVIAGIAASGSFTRPIVTVGAAVTLTAVPNSHTLVRIGSGGTPTLPTAVGNTTATFTLKNEDTVDHNVPTTGGQTIEGFASPYVLPPGQSINVHSNNTNWRQF
jgi:hypothetical protein